jgi:hypothetical protein
MPQEIIKSKSSQGGDEGPNGLPHIEILPDKSELAVQIQDVFHNFSTGGPAYLNQDSDSEIPLSVGGIVGMGDLQIYLIGPTNTLSTITGFVYPDFQLVNNKVIEIAFDFIAGNNRHSLTSIFYQEQGNVVFDRTVEYTYSTWKKSEKEISPAHKPLLAPNIPVKFIIFVGCHKNGYGGLDLTSSS